MVDPAAEQLLSRARVARLATVDEDGRPHIVPVVFVIENEAIYTPVDAKPKSVAPERLRRVRNIRANPNVQVLVDHFDEDWSRLAYVQVRGTATLLERGHELDRAHRLLETKYEQYRTMPLEGYPAIRVEIDDIVHWASS